MPATYNIVLADMAAWNAFVADNREALEMEYRTIQNALDHATQGGLVLGGGAAPEFVITFAM